MSSHPSSRREKVGLFNWASVSATPTGPAAHAAPDDKPTFPSSDTDAPSAEDVRDRIVSTWKTVWAAFYKRHQRASFYRIDELRGLCLGAGASVETLPVNQLLGPLDSALALAHDHSHSPGLQHLKLEEDTSLELLRAVLRLLDAYAEEIDPVNQIGILLRSAQVGLREPTVEDWAAAKDRIIPLAETAGRKLVHYHARLHVLQLDIETEALSQRPDGRPRWLLVRDLAYPPSNKLSSLSK